MLKVSNITKSYGSEKVLNKISFNIERRQKVALVGYNGTGKSTLLKIIAGIIKPDIGKISFAKNVTVGFLPQETSEYKDEKVVDFIQKYVGYHNSDFDRNVSIMFAGFGLSDDFKNKIIGELSSGQKTKVFLTALLLKKVDLLLLDEPTNNLDLPALIWLEDFLVKTDTAFIAVSHDRKFLNRVATKIFAIDWKTRNLEITNGKYIDYLSRKEKEYARQLQEHIENVEERKRLEASAEAKQEKAREGAKHVTKDKDKFLQGYYRDKAADSYRQSKVLYNRIKKMGRVEKPNLRKQFEIAMDPELSPESCDIETNDLICGYDDGFRIGPINLSVRFGDQVCILGLNGAGKSTLLKTLTSSVLPIGGELRVGAGVKFGNLMQEHESLPNDKTVIKFMLEKVYPDHVGIDDENDERLKEGRGILQNHLLHFGFSEWQVKSEIKELSPGARARLLLAYFSASKVNVLILDEPTNHLDMEATDALYKALAKFSGTVITVTHDRFFVEKTKVSNLYHLENGVLTKIPDFKTYVGEMEKRAKKLLRMIKG